jgi:DNA-binding NarL/FixJ family response regulator
MRNLEELSSTLKSVVGTDPLIEIPMLRVSEIATSRREVGNELLSCRVMLVEDFLWFRNFVRSRLEQCPEVGLICEVSDGLKAVEDATSLQPDLIMLDIGLPSLNGIEVARQLRDLAPDSKIIFLSQETSAVLVKEAIALGAWGYVYKSHAEADLLPAIDAALSGRRYVSGDSEPADLPLGEVFDRL